MLAYLVCTTVMYIMVILSKIGSLISNNDLLGCRHSYVTGTQPWDLTPALMVCSILKGKECFERLLQYS